jgi:transposase
MQYKDYIRRCNEEYWCTLIGEVTSKEQLAERAGVHRSTAYKWVDKYVPKTEAERVHIINRSTSSSIRTLLQAWR